MLGICSEKTTRKKIQAVKGLKIKYAFDIFLITALRIVIHIVNNFLSINN